MNDPVRGYTILASPRTGSGYLGSLLGATGVLGKPGEWLDPINQREVMRPGARAGEPEGLIERAATPNGVFGVKLFTWHFELPAAALLAPFVLSQQLVLLRRRDLLGQALSLVRGRQTKQWASYSEAIGEPYYDRARIEQAIRSGANDLATWESFLARTGRTALRLDYEDLIEDPHAAVQSIADMVGVELDGQKVASAFRMQRDELTEVWRKRFLAEQADRLTLDHTWQSDRWNQLGNLIVPVLKRIRRPFG